MAGKQKISKERDFIMECIEICQLYGTLKAKNIMTGIKRTVHMKHYYKEMYPDATKDVVKKKFNSLRTNYRKELKKHKVLTLVCCQYYCAINIDRLGSRGHTIILYNKSIVQYY
jgi:hypothetical protein